MALSWILNTVLLLQCILEGSPLHLMCLMYRKLMTLYSSSSRQESSFLIISRISYIFVSSDTRSFIFISILSTIFMAAPHTGSLKSVCMGHTVYFYRSNIPHTFLGLLLEPYLNVDVFYTLIGSSVFPKQTLYLFFIFSYQSVPPPLYLNRLICSEHFLSYSSAIFLRSCLSFLRCSSKWCGSFNILSYPLYMASILLYS